MLCVVLYAVLCLDYMYALCVVLHVVLHVVLCSMLCIVCCVVCCIVFHVVLCFMHCVFVACSIVCCGLPELKGLFCVPERGRRPQSGHGEHAPKRRDARRSHAPRVLSGKTLSLLLSPFSSSSPPSPGASSPSPHVCDCPS